MQEQFLVHNGPEGGGGCGFHLIRPTGWINNSYGYAHDLLANAGNARAFSSSPCFGTSLWEACLQADGWVPVQWLLPTWQVGGSAQAAFRGGSPLPRGAVVGGLPPGRRWVILPKLGFAVGHRSYRVCGNSVRCRVANL